MNTSCAVTKTECKERVSYHQVNLCGITFQTDQNFIEIASFDELLFRQVRGLKHLKDLNNVLNLEQKAPLVLTLYGDGRQ